MIMIIIWVYEIEIYITRIVSKGIKIIPRFVKVGQLLQKLK
jgi:hypothetical protein